MFNNKKSASIFACKLPAVAMSLAFVGILCSSGAIAQGAESSAVTTPNSDLAKLCAAGATSVDRATCLKEAAAAKSEAKRGQLSSPSAAYDANALQRCEALPESDKQQCQLRIKGAGSTDGTVGGGGLMREVRTRVPDASSPGTAPAPASSMGDAAK